VKLGLDPDQFWDKTPKEIKRITMARDHRLNVEHNDRMLLAYTTAVLPRMKRMPKLDKLQVKLKGRKPGKPRQTEAQQIAVATMWAALGYGKIRKKEKTDGSG